MAITYVSITKYLCILDYNVEDVRLTSLWATPFASQGLFEVFVDGEWGSFAELGMIEANIICKHLGFL